MSDSVPPTLQVIVDQAVAATGASAGWLLGQDGPDGSGALRVRAVAGGSTTTLGRVLTPTGARAYVLSSGEAAVLLPQPDDPANDGAGGFVGVPPSILAAPCGDDPSGVLEVVDKADGLPFTFDDITVVTALAAVAASALADDAGNPAAPTVPSPEDLAAALGRLAQADPARYRDTAHLIAALLGH